MIAATTLDEFSVHFDPVGSWSLVALVALLLAAGDQRMDGRLEADRLGARRNVMHAAVGDGDPHR